MYASFSFNFGRVSSNRTHPTFRVPVTTLVWIVEFTTVSGSEFQFDNEEVCPAV